MASTATATIISISVTPDCDQLGLEVITVIGRIPQL
jgi:hypothetical protein